MRRRDGLRTAQYWRDRAEEARARAEELRDHDAEAAMQEVSRMYDRLADLSAKRKAKKVAVQSD
jgi:hypothetical protein